MIDSFEKFITQVFSISSLSILGGQGEMGSVILAMNDDGSVKTNDKGEVEILTLFPDTLLFRGQIFNFPLIPKLGRAQKNIYIERVEKKLIDDIKRRGDKLIQKGDFNDWDLLVYVQHYGLTTRLLDWTSNPLIALWFACQGDNKNNAYVYVLKQTDDNLLNLQEESSPFTISKTKIFRPNLNNDRIISQNGWFTIHSLKNDSNKFIPLDQENDFKDKIWVIEIPNKNKAEMLVKLNILGINDETIYPGIEGACKYINWVHE
jgi:hypothetical protein